MSVTIERTIDENGRILIPASWLRKNKIEPGEKILADIDDSAILIMPKGRDDDDNGTG